MEPIAEIAKRLQEQFTEPENSTESPSPSPFECAECGGTGYVQGADKFMRLCSCVAQKRVEKRLPPRYKRASLLDFPESVQRFALDWIGKPGDGLLVTGPCGTGKTHLLAAICRSLVLIHEEAYFRRCADLYSELRKSYSDNQPETAILDSYCTPKWLVLDDLGAGSLSDFERRNTLEILDQRFNQRRPTAISTNWTIEEIAKRMDDRIASRLGSLTVLALSGEDRRQAE